MTLIVTALHTTYPLARRGWGRREQCGNSLGLEILGYTPPRKNFVPRPIGFRIWLMELMSFVRIKSVASFSVVYL